MSTYRGQDGVMKIETITVAEMKSWEVGTQTDAIDVTPKGSDWRKKKPGHKSWSGRATVMFDPATASAQEAVRTIVMDASSAGLTATMGVAILLPFTFGMDPLSGLLMICGVFFGGKLRRRVGGVPGD